MTLNIPKRRSRSVMVRRWRALLVAGVAGAAFVVLLRLTRTRQLEIAPMPEDRWRAGEGPTPKADPRLRQEEAVALRADAQHACDTQHWIECLHDLDQAKERDPEGDRAPAVQDERARAMKAFWGGGRK